MVTPKIGGPELFEERDDVERPSPGPGQLLVRVLAASTNPIDTKLRADGSFAGLEPPVILGADVSGVIEEVGPDVEDLAPDDEVYYTPEIFGPGSNGAYAEYNVADADIVAKKPASLSHEETAIPLAGGTAYEALVRRLALRVGETILIQGGAGGVGSFAVQIAKAAGARVLATAGTDNQETLKTLGADLAMDYSQDDITQTALDDTAGAGVDAVFDTVGGDTVVNSIPATRPYERIATILGGQGDFTPC
jgi:NADPH:quinone reductase